MEKQGRILITLSTIWICVAISSCAIVANSPSQFYQDAIAKHYQFTHSKQPQSQADWLELVEEFKRVIEGNPPSDIAENSQYAIGSCYLWLSEKSPSLTAGVSARSRLGAKTDSSHSRKAIAAFQKFATKYPNSHLVADARYWSGDCYLRLGDVKNATVQFRQVVEENTGSKIYEYALLRLGECYENQGDYQTAIEQYAEIVASSENQQLVKFAYTKLPELWAKTQPEEQSAPSKITPRPPNNPSTQEPEIPERTVVIKRILPKTEISNAPTPKPIPSDTKLTEIKKPSSLSLVQQLGLSVGAIVIDPGHGGKDPGAVGRRGTLEKNVALNIAKELKSLLQERKYRVYLTREEDVYIRLKNRTRFANEKSADLFISIHCNAHHSASATGLETYYLSLASDESARLTAARENAEAGMSIKDLDNLVSDILKDSKMTESSRLAECVQKHLVEEIGAVNRGVKRAPFVVLIGTKVPAILVEVGFMSNQRDERRLRSSAYQALIASALFKAIEEYVANCSLTAVRR